MKGFRGPRAAELERSKAPTEQIELPQHQRHVGSEWLVVQKVTAQLDGKTALVFRFKKDYAGEASLMSEWFWRFEDDRWIQFIPYNRYLRSGLAKFLCQVNRKEWVGRTVSYVHASDYSATFARNDPPLKA